MQNNTEETKLSVSYRTLKYLSKPSLKHLDFLLIIQACICFSPLAFKNDFFSPLKNTRLWEWLSVSRDRQDVEASGAVSLLWSIHIY